MGEAASDEVTKGYRHGTHRTVPPPATIARIRPWQGALGITRVANVTGLDRIGLPVVMVCRPNARSVAVQQGKGLTLEAAKASGLMEAVETFHAEHIRLPLRLACHAELAEEVPLVAVGVLPRIARSRYHPHLPLLWIEGRDLLAGRPVWLPYELVHADYTLPQPTGAGCFPASTNGLASGNHRLEAIVHGVCEVIERDATSLFHHLVRAERDARRIELASVPGPDCRDVLARLEATGLKVGLWDTTTDIGVPSFYCVLIDLRVEEAHIGVGAGCHPSSEVALLRALCEAVQVRMTYISGARDDLPPDQFASAGRQEKLREARLLMASGRGRRDFGAIPCRDLASFGEDLAWLVERLRAAGIEQVITLDLTRPEIGLPVMRVVVPGLEAPHDTPDYVPGPRVRALLERGR